MSSSSGTDDLSLAKGGPVTQEGKEVARWNATRHGIRSPAPVVPGIERTEDWEEHSEGVLESLSPEGHLETVLAERVALLSWRLHRVTRFETESRQRPLGGLPGAHRPRGGGPGSHRAGLEQRRDREAALPQPKNRQEPRLQYLPQAASGRPGTGHSPRQRGRPR
jgi:hypothetical protein